MTDALVSAKTFELKIEMVSVDTPPGAMTTGEKFFPMPEPARTVRVALAADVFVAPCVLEIAPIGRVLVRLPCWNEDTLTEMLQVPPPAMPAPESAKLAAPGTAETVPPAHVVEAPGTDAMTIPAGRLSVSATPVSATAVALERVTERTEVPPPGIETGLKLLLSETVRGVLTRFAVAAVTVVTPSASVSAPAGMVLTEVVAVLEVTSAETVQLPGVIGVAAGIEAPESEIEPEPGTAVTDPPAHVVEALAGLATVTS